MKELDTMFWYLREKSADAELQALMNEVNAYCKEGIAFPEFVSLMSCEVNIPPEEDLTEDLREIFDVLDKSESGFISFSDFRLGMSKFGVPSEEVEDMIMKADDAINGQICFKTFVKMMS